MTAIGYSIRLGLGGRCSVPIAKVLWDFLIRRSEVNRGRIEEGLMQVKYVSGLVDSAAVQ